MWACGQQKKNKTPRTLPKKNWEKGNLKLLWGGRESTFHNSEWKWSFQNRMEAPLRERGKSRKKGPSSRLLGEKERNQTFFWGTPLRGVGPYPGKHSVSRHGFCGKDGGGGFTSAAEGGGGVRCLSGQKGLQKQLGRS